MSVTIDDIWSLPISQPEVSNHEDNLERPTKRRRSTLFLEGSDEESGTELHAAAEASPKAPSRPDIDSLFENLDEPDITTEVPQSFDLDAYRREADKHAAEAAPSSPRALQSSSPPRENDSNANGRRKRKGAGDDEPKERKPLPKLDHARLLGKDGLPALVTQSKTFKPHGKGHELSDLNRLMNMYQFWAHKLFPKIQFSDLVERVEKLCHSKRMHVALSVWRDENKKYDDPSNVDMDENNETSDQEIERNVDQQNRSSSPSSASSSHLLADSDTDDTAPRPPASASEVTSSEEDNSSMDYNMDDGPSEAAASSQEEQETSKGYHWKEATRSAEIDEEEALWAEIGDLPGAFDDLPPEMFQEAPQKKPVQQSQTVGTRVTSQRFETDDGEMWDIVDELERSAPKGISVAPDTNEPLEGNARTADAVNKSTEISEVATQHESTESQANSKELAVDTFLQSAKNNISTEPSTTEAHVPTNDEGWDDMYI